MPGWTRNSTMTKVDRPAPGSAVRRALALLLALASGVTLSCAARAESVAGPTETVTPVRVAWQNLGATEQQVLAPVRAQWDQLQPRQQERLRNVVVRWQAAPPERRSKIEERVARWARLDPQQRAAAAERWNRFKRMTPEERAGVREAYRNFGALPPAQRAALRERYRAMSPPERAAFVAGVQAQRSDGAWRELMADVPPAQRAPLRAMWRAFTPAERNIVRQYLRTLPQAGRPAVRERLLGMDEAQRRDYIATLPPPKL
jgi:hypothetical protein